MIFLNSRSASGESSICPTKWAFEALHLISPNPDILCCGVDSQQTPAQGHLCVCAHTVHSAGTAPVPVTVTRKLLIAMFCLCHSLERNEICLLPES